MMTIDNPLNAFVAHSRIEALRAEDGPLARTTFAMKDLFDVAGVATGAGSPDWLATHLAPTSSTPIYDRLLDAGARMVGKTCMDELAWSLTGSNAHYGTPTNPAAPGRIPGGSSSGSAAAVAGKLVDFSIGSDTGGSVRLPASFCGIYGIRTTHGRISMQNSVPLAPSYDAAGWFARTPELMLEIAKVLFEDFHEPRGAAKAFIAEDLFAAVDEQVRDALHPAVDRILNLLGGGERISIAENRIAEWREAFRVLQSEEAWATHGSWIQTARPTLGPGIKERFASAAIVGASEIKAAKALRFEIAGRLQSILAGGAVLILPTAPGIAPLLEAAASELDTFRNQAIDLLCASGHAGTPQLSIPAAIIDDCPIGLSLMGWRHCDEQLLQIAVELQKP